MVPCGLPPLEMVPRFTQLGFTVLNSERLIETDVLRNIWNAKVL
jgi:hypothetical protein